ncbi:MULTISPECIES: hypothetical protein [unclassified Tolypothrix]|uniref:hypothetical protein n=1 Tax=unclassified Tolypothrix TaxID=2649714 RepID=UPI0005EAB287|nr:MULTISPECIES: hypothetical protein [unclassified Tolypothrix]BAY91802.1 hypothetical protein NIES3275_38290 [Microchaete diplosiphon NIES-3275]EKF05051.1 hypothetical protein FDUTEX481_01219 [Tolypothrix sp. PCC 7601]MBE9087065.1 hypothetical protein [Tolypothrix sp. LEGE 11397]UYD25812.1 hypothetical protein HGR01_31515 [Tolypothrix sp. PCC 7712]UYD31948.1 hypothetical protein HG267_23015 [Tolypothrix sp. PCC 7601]
MSLNDVIKLAKQLSSVDKLRLIQEITPDLERELMYGVPIPRKSLWGLCADLGSAPSTEEIDESRSEEWINFPREDI